MKRSWVAIAARQNSSNGLAGDGQWQLAISHVHCLDSFIEADPLEEALMEAGGQVRTRRLTIVR